MGPYVSWIAERLSEGRVRRDLAPCLVGAPVVMSGDFNHVPASGPIRRFEQAGLRDVLAGTGLHALTWPSGGGWPDFPVFRLDHVLAGPVSLTDLVKTRVPGSDHQGWVFEVSAASASR
jgi:endonuclease/exonuclease/phosphatase (EEP) superfamily protein YafD